MSETSERIKISRDEMMGVTQRILELNGTPSPYAFSVADSLIQAQEAGHASHGIIRLLEYSKFVETGLVIPDAAPSVIQESSSTFVIDGGWGWGQISCKLAVEMAIARAHDNGVMAFTVKSCNHIGRLGEYVELLAEKSLIGIMFCNSDPSVAAYGGKTRLLGTNPFAASIPTSGKPIVLDFATAASAEGKLRVARATGAKIKDGIVVDKDGKSSTDPETFYAGGALLPFGEHKGYGLSLLIELLGGALSGNHPGLSKNYKAGNGAVLIVLNPRNFQTYENFLTDIDETSEVIRHSAPVDPKSPILLPGDVENITREGNKAGILLDATIWESILDLDASLAMR
jgi:uncharacterized oxidoreductase